MKTQAKTIGIVGGVERAGRLLDEAAQQRGHHLELHDGKMNGTGDRTLARLVQRSDLVVVTTDINSHAGVRRARELARQHNRPCVLVRRLGPGLLNRMLDDLDTKQDVRLAMTAVDQSA